MMKQIQIQNTPSQNSFIMNKTLSTQSLLNLRRSSVHKVTFDSKQHLTTDKITSKPKIPFPYLKPTSTQSRLEEAQKPQLKKNDIKQIYEYKIKQKAKLFKLHTENSHQSSKSKLIQSQNQPLEDHRYMETLKLQNEKMSKQLCDIAKENKRLKELLINAQNSKISTKNTVETINTQKDYKKQMLSKLNERQRLKTQMTAYFSKAQLNQSKAQKNQKKDKISKDKKSGSKNKQRDSSRNSITMNLNMSFVKMKSPSSGKNADFVKNHSKEMMDQMIRSSSTKQLIHFKEQSNQCSQLVSPKQKQPASIKQLFKGLSQKKQVNVKDLEQFYSLNKKIFAEFNELILFSKQTFTQLLNKTNISECYDSKRLQESKHSGAQNTKMKTLLGKIQQLYRENSIGNGNFNTIGLKYDERNDDSSAKKYNVSEIEPNELLTPESSVISFTQIHNNPQREKSYEKYRLKKLNQNLGLIANFQNKKLRTQVTEAGTTEPKVFFSKPVSTHVSRKISFNNSFNNSLKNSKIQ